MRRIPYRPSSEQLWDTQRRHEALLAALLESDQRRRESTGLLVTSYLGTLDSDSARHEAHAALVAVTQLLRAGSNEPSIVGWDKMRYEHVAALRSRLVGSSSPDEGDVCLAVVRGILRHAWCSGQLGWWEYLRAADVPPLRNFPYDKEPLASLCRRFKAYIAEDLLMGAQRRG